MLGEPRHLVSKSGRHVIVELETHIYSGSDTERATGFLRNQQVVAFEGVKLTAPEKAGLQLMYALPIGLISLFNWESHSSRNPTITQISLCSAVQNNAEIPLDRARIQREVCDPQFDGAPPSLPSLEKVERLESDLNPLARLFFVTFEMRFVAIWALVFASGALSLLKRKKIWLIGKDKAVSRNLDKILNPFQWHRLFWERGRSLSPQYEKFLYRAELGAYYLVLGHQVIIDRNRKMAERTHEIVEKGGRQNNLIVAGWLHFGVINRLKKDYGYQEIPHPITLQSRTGELVEFQKEIHTYSREDYERRLKGLEQKDLVAFEGVDMNRPGAFVWEMAGRAVGIGLSAYSGESYGQEIPNLREAAMCAAVSQGLEVPFDREGVSQGVCEPLFGRESPHLPRLKRFERLEFSMPALTSFLLVCLVGKFGFGLIKFLGVASSHLLRKPGGKLFFKRWGDFAADRIFNPFSWHRVLSNRYLQRRSKWVQHAVQSVEVWGFYFMLFHQVVHARNDRMARRAHEIIEQNHLPENLIVVGALHYGIADILVDRYGYRRVTSSEAVSPP